MEKEICGCCGLEKTVIVPTAKQLNNIEKYILQGKEIPSIVPTEATEVYVCRTPYCNLRSNFKPDKEWRYKRMNEY